MKSSEQPVFYTWASCAITLALVMVCTGCAGLTGNSSVGMNKIQHVVFIVKENHTFDNYFGTFPGADGATSGTISTGAVIPLGRTPDPPPRDINHSWDSALTAMDNGKMDHFDLIIGPDCNLNGDYLCMTQYQQADIPNYWSYAKTFTLADRYFTSLHGPSVPNHLYAIAAQSGGLISDQTPESPLGCASDPGTTVTVLDANGSRGFDGW